jgi:hypothetical protein
MYNHAGSQFHIPAYLLKGPGKQAHACYVRDHVLQERCLVTPVLVVMVVMVLSPDSTYALPGKCLQI